MQALVCSSSAAAHMSGVRAKTYASMHTDGGHLDIEVQGMRQAAQQHDGAAQHEEVTREALQGDLLYDGIIRQRRNPRRRHWPEPHQVALLSAELHRGMLTCTWALVNSIVDNAAEAASMHKPMAA